LGSKYSIEKLEVLELDQLFLGSLIVKH